MSLSAFTIWPEIDAADAGYTSYDTALATATTLQINQGLQALDIDGVNIHYLDLFTLLQRVQANPSAYGFISVDSTNACVDNACQTLTLEQQNQYLWMDFIHFTTGFEETIGQYAANLISAGNVTALHGDSTLAVMDLFQQNTLSQLRSSANWVTKENYHWYLTPQSGSHRAEVGRGSVAVNRNRIWWVSPPGVRFQRFCRIHPGGRGDQLQPCRYRPERRLRQQRYRRPAAGGFLQLQQGCKWFVDGGVSASLGGLDLVRTGVFEDLKANPNTHALGAFAQAGYLFDVGEKGFKLGPVATLRYTDASVDSYSESGDSLLTISVDDQEIQQLVGVGRPAAAEPSVSESGKLSYQLQLSAEHQEIDDRDLTYYQTNTPDRALTESVEGDGDTFARLSGSLNYQIWPREPTLPSAAAPPVVVARVARSESKPVSI